MSATRELIAALVAGGMDAVDAAALVARAGAEMASGPSKAALRTRKWRITKASQNVTGDANHQPSQNVTERHEPSHGDAAEKPPLILTSSIETEDLSKKKENKKERTPKTRDASLPDNWKPPARAYRVAEEHAVTVETVEPIFRDYLASSGKRYADYDAAFCNFLRNQNKFNGGARANGTGNTPKTGHAGFLAAAARKAERLFGNGDLAGDGGAAEFSRGDGVDRGRADPIDVTPRRNSSGHCRDESGPGDVREGEIFPPDKNGSGFSDGLQRH